MTESLALAGKVENMVTRKNPIFDTATTLGKILGFLGVSAICGVLVAGLLVPAAAVSGSAASGSIQFFDTLPAELQVDPPSQNTTILAKDGSPIASIYAENRTKVPLDQMSPFIKDAVIAIEDSRFYEHGGIDTTGIMRALVSTARGNKQGASTITQQYVNNVINESLVASGKEEDVKLNGLNKGVGDKLREMKLAIALEKKFSKEQILEGYLNIVFFNRDAYGIEAASKFFFSTTAKDLTLPQAALLAGLVNSPSAFDPISNPDNSKKRRDLVLAAMVNQGKITQAEYDEAVATPVTTKVTPARQGCAYATMAPYFCDYVLHLLLNNPAYGETSDDREKRIMRGGLTIQTTLDPTAQAVAQQQVDGTAGANPDKWGASIVSVQPGTGQIVSMAQNTVWLPQEGKFDQTQNFNVDVMDAKGNDLNGIGGFQPGSTMKPFTFAQWLNEGKSMNQTVNAAQRRYPQNFPWKNTCETPTVGWYDATNGTFDLQNSDEGYYRNMTVLYGLMNSINTATFASAAQVDLCGIQKIVDAVGIHGGLPARDKETGKITDPNPKVTMTTLSNLIGATQTAPLTMASAFATFAADGKYCEPIAITSVKDQTGADLPAQSSNCKDAVKPEVARGVAYAMQEVLNAGSGSLIRPALSTKNNFPVAAKTGTNDSNGSTWVVGYTTGLATASWFGDPLGDQLRPGRNLTINGKFYQSIDGYMIAGPQFTNFMLAVAPAYGTNPFPAPPSNLMGGGAPQRNNTPAPNTQNSQAPSNSGNSGNNGNNNGGNGNNNGPGKD
ncbi:transglycosylase domain-containing protein [Paenarthrobacter ureafaciens]|uniref:transglycosylase domain-containing protein n=1 Tax=Paenarthrobacter ureafaciens TaxID=37931 RepID=UPI001ED19491|nr:transglycosylase domain-containing protein [Paenarthrobacter ureafaciens]MCX8455800.1 transglycosylase domain-containing protein [Paenarthrobacter ureafaciens]MCY0973936.1 transglycosylase domain-containing protein [Paenarthrobacter ureafaciens]